MVKNTFTHARWAVAGVCAAAVISTFTLNASAAMLDLFATDPTTPGGTPASISATSLLAVNGGVTNTVFGTPGYTGNIAVPLGVVDTVTEGFSANGSSNQLTISETGVASAAPTVSATKFFSNALTPSTTYTFTLTRTSGYTVGLLGSATVSLTDNGANLFTNASGGGLLGAVDVLSLFGSGSTATFSFTTPATLPSTTLEAVFSDSITASVLGGSVTFSQAQISNVPEPSTAGAALIGLGGLALLRVRRRSRGL
jgi:MYXO-CTERM domain-containing protein